MLPLNVDLIADLNNSLSLQLPNKISYEEIHSQLSIQINQLIKNNFEALVALLYKIDVNEEKLKHFLIDNPNEDAGNVIASLIIERQQQKLNLKTKFKKNNTAGDNEEKW